jgi:hypothetical protein
MRSLTETVGESGGDLRRTPQQNLLTNRTEKKRKEKAKQRQVFFSYRERTCKAYRNNRGKVEKGQKSANQKRETEEIHKWQQKNSETVSTASDGVKCAEAKVVTNGNCQNRNGKHGSLTTVTARVQQL